MRARNKEVNRRNQKRWVEDNKEEHYRRIKDNRDALRAEVTTYKENNPCTDCGGYFAGCAMDFDHINDDKFMGIAKMVSLYGRKRIWEEIAKCELVCANCHRVRTYTRKRIGPVL